MVVDTSKYCFYTINHLKGIAEVKGPTLEIAKKYAQSLGGIDINVVSSAENTVRFVPPKQDE